MSKEKEISATEKLLEMIRSEEDDGMSSAPATVNEPSQSSSPREKDDIEFHLEIDPSPDPTADTLQGKPPVLNLDLEEDFTSPTSLKIEKPDTIEPISQTTSGAPETDKEDDVPVLSLEMDTDKAAQPEKVSRKEPDLDEDDEHDDIKKLSEKLSTVEKEPVSDQTSPKIIGAIRSKLKFAQKLKIGVDLQPECINLAKLSPTSLAPKVSNYLAVPMPARPEGGNGPFFSSPAVIEALSTNLAIFTEGTKTPEIWCTFKSKRVRIVNVIIPKIPEKEIANALFWATKKEVDFDLAEYVFDYAIVKEIEDGKLKKIIAIVYLFHKEEINGVKAMFKKIGFPLTGICHYSSAINNIIHQQEPEADNKAIVHLSFSKPTANIDVYHKGLMLFTREIKTGINSYAESVLDLVGDQQPDLDEQTAIEIAFDSTKNRLAPLLAVLEKPLAADAIRDLTEISTNDRLIRQLNRTFDFCSTNFKIPRVSKLYNSGPLTLKEPLLEEIHAELDITCEVIDVFKSDQDKQKATVAIQNAPKNLNPSPAFGLALANNANTPNFLFTYADKARHVQETRSNQLISLVTIALAIILGAISFFYYQDLTGKQSEVDELREALARFHQEEPRSADSTYALVTTNKIGEIIKQTNDKAARFRVIALVNNVTSLVPERIKLTEIDLTLNPKQVLTSKRKDKSATANNSMAIKGFVSGSAAMQNFILLDFQKVLVRQFEVRSATIVDREDITYQGQQILKFGMDLELTTGIMQ